MWLKEKEGGGRKGKGKKRTGGGDRDVVRRGWFARNVEAVVGKRSSVVADDHFQQVRIRKFK